jgi:UDP-N-acetylglucosamine 2-epimerase (non-hydrolysing)
MEAFEPVLVDVRPDWVLVVGDVNSTLAAALVTAKLQHTTGSRLAHVEAGLRSNDWRMPEEVNRVLTDRLSNLLLTPSRDAEPNLIREGIDQRRISFVGNVMIDTLFHALPRARRSSLLSNLALERGRYAVATVHRPSNVDDPERLRTIFLALGQIANDLPVVFPMHPRTANRAVEFGLSDLLQTISVLEPLGYNDMLCLTDGAAVVLTDSGGLQEETTALGVPCLTLREQTERPVTITHGTNRIAPWPLTIEGIRASVENAVVAGRIAPGERCPEGWDGRAAQRILLALLAD